MRIWGKFYPFPGIQEGERGKIQEARLEVYLNSFRNAVSIKFQIPNQKVVSIKIYDIISGKVVKSFDFATYYFLLATSVVWDGRYYFGRRLPSGVYFIRLESGEFKIIEKMVLLR
uniref:T9SS type A sorting domain-containing protein n=1 Tax=candidate division WOR-3 bacterium TaxID=2052148 RepID=A0A7V3RI41_UNCW3